MFGTWMNENEIRHRKKTIVYAKSMTNSILIILRCLDILFEGGSKDKN